MRRGREFLGLAVYAGHGSGQPAGEVRDLLLSHDGRVVALVVAPRKGFMRREALVPVDACKRIDRNGAVLAAADLPAKATPGVSAGVRLYTGADALCGKRLVGEDGETIGSIADVVFERGELRLWGFEVSDGILRDLLDGRPVVEAGGAVAADGCVVLRPRGRHMNLSPGGHPTP